LQGANTVVNSGAIPTTPPKLKDVNSMIKLGGSNLKGGTPTSQLLKTGSAPSTAPNG